MKGTVWATWFTYGPGTGYYWPGSEWQRSAGFVTTLVLSGHKGPRSCVCLPAFCFWGWFICVLSHVPSVMRAIVCCLFSFGNLIPLLVEDWLRAPWSPRTLGLDRCVCSDWWLASSWCAERTRLIGWNFLSRGVVFLTALLKFGVCYLDVQESSIKCHLNVSTKLLFYFTLMGSHFRQLLIEHRKCLGWHHPRKEFENRWSGGLQWSLLPGRLGMFPALHRGCQLGSIYYFLFKELNGGSLLSPLSLRAGTILFVPCRFSLWPSSPHCRPGLITEPCPRKP